MSRMTGFALKVERGEERCRAAHAKVGHKPEKRKSSGKVPGLLHFMRDAARIQQAMQWSLGRGRKCILI